MRVPVLQLASAAVLLVLTAGSLSAQRRPTPTTATKPSAQPSAQAKDKNGAKTNFTLFAGIATGDSYDMGIALQGSFRIEKPEWPVAVRVDPYLARHNGNFGYAVGGGSSESVTLTMLGVAGDAEYTFKTTNAQVEPYVLGGLGIYYGSVGYSSNVSPGLSGNGADTNFGFGLGGGIRFAKRWAAEAQLKVINSFDTIPIMIGYHF